MKNEKKGYNDNFVYFVLISIVVVLLSVAIAIVLGRYEWGKMEVHKINISDSTR